MSTINTNYSHKEVNPKNLRIGDYYTRLVNRDSNNKDTSWHGDVFRVTSINLPFIHSEKFDTGTNRWEHSDYFTTDIRKHILMRVSKKAAS